MVRIGRRTRAVVPPPLVEALRGRIVHQERIISAQAEELREAYVKRNADLAYARELERELEECRRLLALSEVIYEDELDVKEDVGRMTIHEVRHELKAYGSIMYERGKRERKRTRGQKAP